MPDYGANLKKWPPEQWALVLQASALDRLKSLRMMYGQGGGTEFL
jgi:hypothetical protein